MPRLPIRRAALILFVSTACLAPQAHGAERPPSYPVQVPAGDLTAALELLARQTGLEMVYQTDQLKGVRTQGASGNLPAEAAVKKLLEGTALTLHTDPSGAVLVALSRPSDSASVARSAGDERGPGGDPTQQEPTEGASGSERQPPPTAAEPATGTLTGRITSAGEPVAGVTVTATSASLAEPRVVTTGDNGDYWLPDLPPGTYSLHFELEGLVPVTEEAQVSSDESTTLDIQMSLHEVREDIVVTGSHIRGVHPESSALIVISQEQIARSGVTTVDQLLRQLPQNFSSLDQDTFQANTGDIQASTNSTRGAAVDLRGLGAGTTLTLVNGHRLASSGEFGNFVDVSLIPLSAIDRVEVLTDGASALYGADAVAGVVNFILKKDFSGAETSIRYGRTGTAGVNERRLSQALGHSWSGGNAMIVYEYYDQDDLLTSDRDFIPDQGGKFALIPGQERHSVFSTLRQDVGAGLEISAEGFYSDRRFEQDNTFFSSLLIEESGGAETYGGAATLSKELTADWAVNFTGNYATTRELRKILFPPDTVPSISRTDTVLLEGNLRADGPLWTISGGDVRASIGVDAREDRFGDDMIDLSRRVNSAYGELFIPLIGRNNSVALAQRLELSLAGRYDDYGDVGSSSNPKVGMLWEPVASVILRGTYGTSFRAPPLSQLRRGNDSFFVLGIDNPQGASLCPQPDPLPPTPCTITLVTASPWNPDLRPEEARSFSLGLDLTPAQLPGLMTSVTYFDIEFEDRIASPPLSAGVFGIFSETDVLAPFLDFSPDLAEVTRIFAEEDVLNLAGVGPGGVEVRFDGRLQNLAKTRTSGLDLIVNYEHSLGQNHLSLLGSASYLFKRRDQAASTTPRVDLVNKIYNPPRVRGRAGGTWTRGSWSSTLTVNYTDSYQNNLVTPVDAISSWTTADLQLAWRMTEENAPSLLGGLSVSLDILNLTDEDPPRVSDGNNINLGFDPTNASPRGRFIAAQIGKRW